MRVIKVSQMNKLKKLCEERPDLANDKNNDYINIVRILVIDYSLNTLELVILIINSSYILGMLWFIMCDAVEDFYLS